jgi:hypothetical protein
MGDRDSIVHVLCSGGLDREEALALTATLDASVLAEFRVALEGRLRAELQGSVDVSCGRSASLRVFDKDGDDITSC